MKRQWSLIPVLCSLLLFSPAPVLGGDPPAPTVDEQLGSLEAMCAESAEARGARHSEKALYERLGGAEKIQQLVAEIVRLHDENPAFDRFMDEVDQKALVRNVSQFVIAGTGGPGKYEGRPMPEAHAHLALTNADFLAAGGDVIQAMKNLGVGEDEIQEMVCILVSMRAAVVVDEDKVLDAASN